MPPISHGQVKEDPYGNVELLIADLGEGKVLGGASSASGREYGNVEYRAPEVRTSGSSACSMASDMYSLGWLADDIVVEYWRAAERKGDHRRLISKTVMDVIMELRRVNPRERPSAEEVSERVPKAWRQGMCGDWDFHPTNIDLIEYEELGRRVERQQQTNNDADDEIPC